MGFMFAPNHHPAMKNVAPVRKEMGVRTIFNILGPLTNPAGAPNTLMGVFHPDLVGIQVRVMQRLGAEHVLVVWGKDGMDEISLGAADHGRRTQGRRNPRIRNPSRRLRPGRWSPTAASRSPTPPESKAMLLAALENKPGTAREIVAFNAGAALYTANLAASHRRRHRQGARSHRQWCGARRRSTSSSQFTAQVRHERHPEQDPRRQARGSRRRARPPSRSPRFAPRRKRKRPRAISSAPSARNRRRPSGRHRRNQEGQPVQRRPARGFSPRGDRRRLRTARRRLPLGAHRPAVLPGRARIPASRPRRLRACRCCARTS